MKRGSGYLDGRPRIQIRRARDGGANWQIGIGPRAGQHKFAPSPGAALDAAIEEIGYATNAVIIFGTVAPFEEDEHVS